MAFGTGADGRPLLASGGEDRMVLLWDPATGDPVGAPLRGHTGWVQSVAFGAGADGQPLLASGGRDEIVQLWDPATGDPVGAPLQGHVGGVQSVAFGAGVDGQPVLASGANDGTVRVWDPATGVTIVTVLRRTAVVAVAMQNTHLAVVDREGVSVIQIMDGTR